MVEKSKFNLDKFEIAKLSKRAKLNIIAGSEHNGGTEAKPPKPQSGLICGTRP